MLLLLLIACDTTPLSVGEIVPQPDSGDDSDSAVTIGVSDWRVEPSLLVLGTLPIGVYETAEVVLTNTGENELTLVGAEVTVGTLLATLEEGAVVKPGERATVALSVAASGTTLDYSTVMLRLSAADGEFEAPIQIVAAGVGPLASLAVAAPELGEVLVGCVEYTAVTVSNDGNRDLNVSSLSVGDAQGLGLEYDPEDPEDVAPPWTLGPGEERSVSLAFAPLWDEEVATILTLASDDVLHPELELPVTATGSTDLARSDSFDVRESVNVTALIAVNEVINSAYAARFEAALPTLFEALLGTGVPYRVAFIHSIDGIVDGSVPYIDDTFTPAEATDIALAMVADAAGDNDYLLSTLDLAIDENTAWLLDEDPAWAESRLNLVGINSDQEQSAGNATMYILRYQAHKLNPSSIVVHGVGGDDPAGCPGAEAFTPFADAATATGGVFLSICEVDWTAHMESLARGFLGDGQIAFTLADPAVEGTLAVYVDEVAQDAGWAYYAANHAVYFDEGALPAIGTVVRVDYVMLPECLP